MQIFSELLFPVIPEATATNLVILNGYLSREFDTFSKFEKKSKHKN